MLRHPDTPSTQQALTASCVFVSVGSDFKPLVSPLTTFSVPALVLWRAVSPERRERKQRKAVKKPLKEYFPCTAFVQPLLRLDAAPTTQTNANVSENFAQRRSGTPARERS